MTLLIFGAISCSNKSIKISAMSNNMVEDQIILYEDGTFWFYVSMNESTGIYKIEDDLILLDYDVDSVQSIWIDTLILKSKTIEAPNGNLRMNYNSSR